MQTSLTFTHRENNRESEIHYESIVADKQSHCKRILAELQAGHRLTSNHITYVMRIGNAIRRIHDLKDSGIDIRSEWVVVGGVRKHKEYYL
jgi:hypothetical protein